MIILLTIIKFKNMINKNSIKFNCKMCYNVLFVRNL